MAIQQINLGNIVNDGLGDDLRTAFEKVNANFGFVDEQIEVALGGTAESVGTGAPIYKGKEDNVLQFKSLVNGRYTAFTETSDTVEIRSTAPQPFTRIDTNFGVVNSDQYAEITIQGGNDVEVTAVGQVITIDATLGLSVLESHDFGPLGSVFDNAIQLSLSAANIDFGLIELPGHNGLDLGELGNI